MRRLLTGTFGGDSLGWLSVVVTVVSAGNPTGTETDRGLARAGAPETTLSVLFL